MPDKIVPIGIGLKRSTWERLDKIAADLGIKRHAVVVYFVRHALKEYEAGNLEIKTRDQPVVDMPD